MEHKKNIHYLAAKKILQRNFGNELDVSDEEFDRWLLDGEIKAYESIYIIGLKVDYWELRYGSKSRPPIHDPSTFKLLDELCKYYYSQNELEQFNPSMRWLTFDQWVKRWMNCGYSSQEATSLIKGFRNLAYIRDKKSGGVRLSLLGNPSRAVAICNPANAELWERTAYPFGSTSIFREPYIAITDLKSGEMVYYTGIPKIIDFLIIKGEILPLMEDGIYHLKHDEGFDLGIRHFAKKQFYWVDEQWYCKTKIGDDEWFEEPIESPFKQKLDLVNIELFSLNSIKYIEKEHFVDIMQSTNEYNTDSANVHNGESMECEPTGRQEDYDNADAPETSHAESNPEPGEATKGETSEQKGLGDLESVPLRRERTLVQWLDIQEKDKAKSFDRWVIKEKRADVWDALSKMNKEDFPPTSPSTIKKFFDGFKKHCRFKPGRRPG